MRALLLLTAGALLLLAPAAQAGHGSGMPIPEGTMVVHVGFVQVTTWVWAPVRPVDDAYASACGATAGQPAGCTYIRRTCAPGDLALLCSN